MRILLVLLALQVPRIAAANKSVGVLVTPGATASPPVIVIP